MMKLLLMMLSCSMIFTGCFCSDGDSCSVDDEYEYDYCDYEYNPVCGEDGYTYENPCEAEKWTWIKHYGACESCDSSYNPVCGGDGYTYDNRCEAEQWSWVAYEGACKDYVACVTDYDCPWNTVCSIKDGETPGFCINHEIASSCEHTLLQQVCGEDGITYYGECSSIANYTDMKHYGPCGDPQDYFKECELDQDCETGMICESNNGVRICKPKQNMCETDTDCNTNQKCDAGLCVENTTDPVDPAYECQEHTDCPSQEYCIIPIDMCQCDANGCDCPDSGFCIAIDEGCYKDADCEGDHYCAPKTCDCEGENCSCAHKAGRCMPKTPEVCMIDSDCPSGLVCNNIDSCYLNEDGEVDCEGFGYCTPETGTETVAENTEA